MQKSSYIFQNYKLFKKKMKDDGDRETFVFVSKIIFI
jgi:hypothetical protein